MNYSLITTQEDIKHMDKISLLSIYSSGKVIEKMKDYIRSYTEKVEPFGCRSLLTERYLKDLKIKSYFSACLTLSFDMQGAILDQSNKQHYALNSILKPNATIIPEEKTKIIFVDCIDLEAVPKSVRNSKNAIYLQAILPRWYPNADKKMPRHDYAYKLLSTYATQAKVVITSRIHVGLPATALGIPVIFVEKSNGWLPGGKQTMGRVEGLLDIFHRVERIEGPKWTFGDLTGNVPRSNGVHLADRYRASFWNRLKKTPFYEDTARLFGMVPFQRLGRENIQEGLNQIFHVVLESESTLCWQTKRVIEHILFFHPNSKVYVHSNRIAPTELEIFPESGYNVIVQKYDADLLLRDNLPLLLLHEYGGVYVSTNTLILKELSEDLEEGVVLEQDGAIAMAYFDRESQEVLKNNLKSLEARKILQTNVMHPPWDFPILSDIDTVKCFKDVEWTAGNLTGKIAVSLHPSSYSNVDTIKIDTECYRAVEVPCIFCDEIHWDF